jgi:hypothetical protein
MLRFWDHRWYWSTRLRESFEISNSRLLLSLRSLNSSSSTPASSKTSRCWERFQAASSNVLIFFSLHFDNTCLVPFYFNFKKVWLLECTTTQFSQRDQRSNWYAIDLFCGIFGLVASGLQPFITFTLTIFVADTKCTITTPEYKFWIHIKYDFMQLKRVFNNWRI